MHINLLLSMPGGAEWLILLLILVLPFFLALIDILKSKFKDGATKVVWVLVVIVFPFLGPILYLLIGRGQKLKK